MAARDFTNYSDHSETQLKQSEKILEMFLESAEKELEAGENIDLVMDAGCGDGEVTQKLDQVLDRVSSHHRIVGVDRSRKRLKQARKENQGSGIKFVQSDLSSFSMKTDLDAIFSNAALHWIENQKKLYRNFNKLLRDKGLLAVHQGAKGSYIELHNIAVKTAEQMNLGIEERMMPPSYLSPGDARKVLRGNGFKVMDMDAVEYPKEDTQIVRDFANASLSTYISRISGDRKKKKFRELFVENGVRWMEDSPENQVTARRLYFTAFKNRS